MVPEARIELARKYKFRGILNPLCLPISPLGHRHIFDGGAFQSRTGLDEFAIRCITALLTRHWSGKRGSNSRHQPWQGCTLPTELFPHCLRCCIQKTMCIIRIFEIMSKKNFVYFVNFTKNIRNAHNSYRSRLFFTFFIPKSN